MKSILKFAVLGLLVALGVQSAAAQSAKRWLILKAPFSFTVERQQLPAGEYRVQLHDGYLRIQSVDGKTGANVITIPVAGKSPEGHGQVVFHRYGEKYFLAQVWTPSHETGRQTLESRDEVELAKQQKMLAQVLPLGSESGR
jgi:hypothetical protein